MSLFYFTSCAYRFNLPEGDIKDFVSAFNGSFAYENVQYGKSYIVNKKYEGEEILLGTHTSYAEFDKRNNEYYHYLETTADGDFVGSEDAQYSFNKKITVCYAKEEDSLNIYAKQFIDGVEEKLEYDFEDVVNSVKNFFYSEVSGGFHTGGVYYGDYILKNIEKYYDRFSLNEDKTELTFEINTSTPTEEGNEILNCHKFVVNNYGLVVSVSTTAYYIANNEVTSTFVTEMSCDYVTNVEKKLNL